MPLVVKTEHARKLVNQNPFNFNDNAKNGKRIKIINQRIKTMTTEPATAEPITVDLSLVPEWDALKINPILASLERIIETCEAMDREIKEIQQTLNN